MNQRKEKSMNEVAEKPDQQGTIVVPDKPYSKRYEQLPAQAQPANLMQALAAAAADPRMDVDKVERLFAMHKELMAREAEAAFNDAMARAQGGIKPVAMREYNDHTKSKYAALADILVAAMPIYTAEGLSVSYDSYRPEFDKDGKEINPPPQGWHRTIAIVSHRGGHSRKYHLDLPLDDAGSQGKVNKTGVQAMGSTRGYARRYLEAGIWNIATFDDDDGNRGRGNGGQLSENEAADHLSAIDAAADREGLQKAFGAAWTAAEKVKDKGAQRLFMQHKDFRKTALGIKS